LIRGAISNRFFKNRVELTRRERQIDDVGDRRSKDRSTFCKKSDRNRIRVKLLVRRKLGGVGGDDECTLQWG